MAAIHLFEFEMTEIIMLLFWHVLGLGLKSGGIIMMKYLMTVLSLIGLFTTEASAATYNWYFNNVEQGKNSEANPVLTTDGKKTQKKRINEKGKETMTEVQGPSSSVEGTSVVKEKSLTEDDERQWRMIVSASQSGYDMGQASQYSSPGGMFSAAYYFEKQIGINLFGGFLPKEEFFAGGELELIPLQLKVFDLDRFIEAGLMLGAMSLGKTKTQDGTLHAGVRLNVNMGPRFGLSSTLRTNISGRANTRYYMSQLGLSYRL